MYILEAQVLDVKATHTDHHALNIITTHSYTKAHKHCWQHQSPCPAAGSERLSEQLIDTHRCSVYHKKEHASHFLCMWFVWCFCPFEFVPWPCLWKQWKKKPGCFKNVFPCLTASLCVNPHKHACLTSVYNFSCRHVHYWLNCRLGVIVWHILTPDSLTLYHI